jgi:ferritin
MLTKKVEEFCNRQIEREGKLIKPLPRYGFICRGKGLAGIAAWLYAQAEEREVTC